MSVIVKGFDMPKGCWDCRLKYTYKSIFQSKNNDIRCVFGHGKLLEVNLDTGFDDNCPLEPYREDVQNERHNNFSPCD